MKIMYIIKKDFEEMMRVLSRNSSLFYNSFLMLM